MTNNNNLISRDFRAIIIWLSICALLVASMVVVGGYTRLSGSGLSITSWKLVHGVVPPLNELQWNEEFEAYKATPQYAQINKGMELPEFKTIFFPEFFHRLLGRVIGFVFAIPLIIFVARQSLSKRFFWRLAAIFSLGGLQGAIGWIMVKSGLVDSPFVSPIKLALHLGIAFIIFGLLLWAVLDANNKQPITNKARNTTRPNPHPQGWRGFTALLFLQIIFGALVAGMHAGLIYNSFPDMNGEFIPTGLWNDTPALTQFIHRTLAMLVVIYFCMWFFLNKTTIKQQLAMKNCLAVFIVLALQFTLGVMTLILQVPLFLALAHQLNALLLWGLSVTLLHKLSNYNKNITHLKLVK